MSKFHNYSFNNTLLIAMQKSEATLVAGYKAWRYAPKGAGRGHNSGVSCCVCISSSYLIECITGEDMITGRELSDMKL